MILQSLKKLFGLPSTNWNAGRRLWGPNILMWREGLIP
jgi:hypothetical protein